MINWMWVSSPNRIPTVLALIPDQQFPFCSALYTSLSTKIKSRPGQIKEMDGRVANF